MGLFDSLKNMFAHHEHHHGASIGQPLTLADAKAVLAFIVVHQQLADMRKVADAVKQLQDEMPQYITFGMSHYYSEPKRVRFIVSRPENAPKLVLVEGKKRGRPGLHLLPMLVTHTADGGFTEEMRRIYGEL